jgi:flagellar hook-basal body complex protein FliE
LEADVSSGLNIQPLNMSFNTVDATGNRTSVDTAGIVENAGIAKFDFAEVLANAGNSVVDTLQKAEATSIAGIKGEANTYEVVSSIMEAEQTLRMTVAIRDKLISAYLEITRMQI